MQDLFGGGQAAQQPATVPPQANVPAELSPEELAAQSKANRRQAEARRAAERQRAQADHAAIIARVHELRGVLDEHGAAAAFMADPTLRDGDAVVTQNGIEVFEGPKGADHVPSDFVPVANSSGPNRANLILLEHASGLSQKPKAAFASVVPALTVHQNGHSNALGQDKLAPGAR